MKLTKFNIYLAFILTILYLAMAQTIPGTAPALLPDTVNTAQTDPNTDPISYLAISQTNSDTTPNTVCNPSPACRVVAPIDPGVYCGISLDLSNECTFGNAYLVLPVQGAAGFTTCDLGPRFRCAGCRVGMCNGPIQNA
ncbi:hypothetical protein HDV00_001613 [Rhizophlyctis rosea]|nr:hypothetical protein HDV00_001613 [Rhizophlyctis rosea]